MFTRDKNGQPVKAGDRVKVTSTNENDGVPDYRKNDIAEVIDIQPSGQVTLGYLNEPLKEVKSHVKTIVGHTEKIN